MANNTKLIFVMCITIFVVTLAGCGKSKKGGQAQNQYDRTWQYNQHNPNGQVWGNNVGCNVPPGLRTQAERCEYVRSSPSLNNCNSIIRNQMVSRECNVGNTGFVVGNVGISGGASIIWGGSRQSRRDHDDGNSNRRRRHHEPTTDGNILTKEETHAVIMDIGLCDPTKPVPVKYVTREQVREVISSGYTSTVTCTKADIKKLGEVEEGTLAAVTLMLESLREIEYKDIIAACRCYIAEVRCETLDQTDGKLTVGPVKSCKGEALEDRIRNCADDWFYRKRGVVSPTVPGCIITVDGATQVRTGNCNDAPTASAPAPTQTSSAPVATVQVPPPAPYDPDASDVIEPENQCYAMKAYRTTLPADTQSVGTVDYRKLSNLENRLIDLRSKMPNGHMVITRTNLEIGVEDSNVPASADLKRAIVDQIFGNTATCKDVSIQESECPLKSVEQGTGNKIVLNGSDAVIRDTFKDTGFLLTYLNYDGQTNIEFVNDKEFVVTTAFRVYFDPNKGTFGFKSGPGILRNRVRITERIVFTNTPNKVKVKADPNLIRLLKETGMERLNPESQCAAKLGNKD